MNKKILVIFLHLFAATSVFAGTKGTYYIKSLPETVSVFNLRHEVEEVNIASHDSMNQLQLSVWEGHSTESASFTDDGFETLGGTTDVGLLAADFVVEVSDAKGGKVTRKITIPASSTENPVLVKAYGVSKEKGITTYFYIEMEKNESSEELL